MTKHAFHRLLRVADFVYCSPLLVERGRHGEVLGEQRVALRSQRFSAMRRQSVQRGSAVYRPCCSLLLGIAVCLSLGEAGSVATANLGKLMYHTQAINAFCMCLHLTLERSLDCQQ